MQYLFSCLDVMGSSQVNMSRHILWPATFLTLVGLFFSMNYSVLNEALLKPFSTLIVLMERLSSIVLSMLDEIRTERNNSTISTYVTFLFSMDLAVLKTAEFWLKPFSHRVSPPSFSTYSSLSWKEWSLSISAAADPFCACSHQPFPGLSLELHLL